jgi:hypothetical protein
MAQGVHNEETFEALIEATSSSTVATSPARRAVKEGGVL